ncbi:MAG: FKBP-type peptidyl-prolyl cis-trans isomerase [Candidatus Marsarchaeota archaeon]|jgi:peptidylprolyl isomerase|nr:FKBP-type peptidyl-prolyl cis-trans isomerase [Candidatus Marsarchaeota archaeon]
MERRLVAVVAAVIVVIAAAYVAFASGIGMQRVAVGDMVSVYYTGSFTNGTVFSSNVGGQPLNFTVGANEVIPGFDSAVIGMGINQSKTVTIPVNEAYGQINPALIISFPISAFGNQTPKAGQIVGENNPAGGSITGIVTYVNATNATVDFNQPLAGHALVFTIRVIRIGK